MRFGLLGLLQSRKGVLSMLILAITSVALYLGKLEGTSYVAALTVIQIIYCTTSAALDWRHGPNDPTIGGRNP